MAHPANPSRRSRRALDLLNFFMADIQTGFGSFLSFYLAGEHWSKADVGYVLTIGSLAGVVSLAPAGAITDAIESKRLLIAAGTLMIAGSALILALWPDFVPVVLAELLHGVTAGIVGPAIGAISLGLVGRRAMSNRIGRNYRFDAAGNAITAALLGLIGASIATSAIFLAAAALAAPTLWALARIDPEEIDYARARNAADRCAPRNAQRLRDLLRNRAILVFALAAFLFRLADASMLPVMSEDLGASAAALSPILLSGLIIVPQLVVAALAPRVGHFSERWGRKPLLLLGFALEPVRALLFALVSSWPYLVVIQLLDGISLAMLAVLTVLVMTDLTAGTGRFNLARGAVATVTGIAASLSTTISGVVAEAFGQTASFLAMAGVAAAAAATLWLLFPESRPADYPD